MPYLPYEEAGITTILSLTSFLLFLNGIRYVLDQFLYCGIIGEILIGIIWGLPVGGTAWLSEGTQETIQSFGYLGLIGLVFEGGLSTDLTLLKKSAGLSVSVATIGLLMPIALSFILLAMPFTTSSGNAYPTPLAAFSAGASLCSTSLGTTFAILSSAGMQKTRVGVVLVGAAMMDDVVGLVMVNIVTTLGNGGTGGWPIARPIAASFGLLLVTLVLAPYALKPIWEKFAAKLASLRASCEGNTSSNGRTVPQRIACLANRIPHLGFMLATAILIIYVTIASFIDASVLFAAFIAGGMVNYLWLMNLDQETDVAHAIDTPSIMYEQYYKSVLDFVLVPFFFASIGFSIPITNMFKASIVWKGIVYAFIMALAKTLVCLAIYFEYFTQCLSHWISRLQKKRHNQTEPARILNDMDPQVAAQLGPEVPSGPRGTNLQPPHSIALLVGFAMMARGEIGFLIASLSQSSGTLGLRHTDGTAVESPGEEVFLVIVWAVVLCTIAGPVGVGVLVRRLRKGNSYDTWL